MRLSVYTLMLYGILASNCDLCGYQTVTACSAKYTVPRAPQVIHYDFNTSQCDLRPFVIGRHALHFDASWESYEVTPHES